MGDGGERGLLRTLTTPESGVLGQGVRFVVSGGTIALVYLATTTILASVVGLPFQLALAIGFSVSIALHFTLQRLFVWTHHEEFELPLHHQVGRYLTVAARRKQTGKPCIFDAETRSRGGRRGERRGVLWTAA